MIYWQHLESKWPFHVFGLYVVRMSAPINLTKSTLIVLDKLDKEGPMSPQDLA